MRISVLPYEKLKPQANLYDVIVTVLDPDFKDQPYYRLLPRKGQTVIQEWFFDIGRDITLEGKSYLAPTRAQCERILGAMLPFLNTEVKVGVACIAGVSRSSAVALMLYAAETNNVETAMKKWLADDRSPEFWPNESVIIHADRMLKLRNHLYHEVIAYKNRLGLPLYMKRRTGWTQAIELLEGRQLHLFE